MGPIGRGPILTKIFSIFFRVAKCCCSQAKRGAHLFGQEVGGAIVSEPMTEVFRTEKRRRQCTSLYMKGFV